MAKNGGVSERDGRYVMHWYDATGKRHDQRLPADMSLRDARAMLRAKVLETARDRAGESCPAQRTTLDAVAAKFFEDRTDLRTSTLVKYREHYDNHIRRPLGHVMLAALTPAVVGPWLARLRRRAEQLTLDVSAPDLTPERRRVRADKPEKGRRLSRSTRARDRLSPGSVGNVEAVLRVVYYYAARTLGMCGPGPVWVKPWAGVKVPKAKYTERVRVHGDDGIARVLASALAIGGLEAQCMVLLCLCLGFRREELCGLRTGDCTPRRAGGFDVRQRAEDVKGGRDEQLVFTGGPAKILAAWLVERAARLGPVESLYAFPVWRESKSRGVVTSRVGDRRARAMKEGKWAAIRRASGLPDTFRFHDLRGSFITESLDRGVPIRVVQKRAKHRRVETTMLYGRQVEDARAVVSGADAFANVGGEVGCAAVDVRGRRSCAAQATVEHEGVMWCAEHAAQVEAAE